LADGEEVGWIGEARVYREADSSGAVSSRIHLSLFILHSHSVSFIPYFFRPYPAVRYAYYVFSIRPFFIFMFSLSVFR